MLLYPLTIALSAFLLFLVQPIIAKQILPWFGGSAGVWTTCLFFFQLVLLLGYAYAHWSVRHLRPRPQAILHVGLLAASLSALPILAGTHWKPSGEEDPSLRILGLLFATVGLPYFLLATTSPLVQAWYARVTDSPYRLFALSNLASLLGLLAYPFLLEPLAGVGEQAWSWSAGYAAFALACAVTAIFSLRHSRITGAVAPGTPATAEGPVAAGGAASPPPSLGTRLTWLALAALGSVLLLTVTNHMTQNVASMPFLWVVPLSLYLLTFILAFEGRGWYARAPFAGPVLVILGAMAWVTGEVSLILDLAIALPVYALGLFMGCMFCHGELALMKPAPRHLTGFYLMVALGGAFGAMLVSIVAPAVLPGDFELHGALVACAALLAWQLRREPVWMRLVAGLATLGLAGATVAHIDKTVRENELLERSFYGSLRVRDTGSFTAPGTLRRLVHGVIQHGEQFVAPGREFEALTYYGPTSGVGVVLGLVDRPGRRVGVIGLGAGTLAAYGREGDFIRFYEINPQVVDIARREFTYLSHTPARVEIALGDARLTLEREAPQRYDVLAVDAFSSDAIPVHLLTREAVEVYLRHLAPGGVIAFHLTNRYLSLPPVVKDIADALGLHAVLITDDPEEDSGYTMSRTDWVLVAREPGLLASPRIAGVAAELEGDGSRLWTDDFNNLFRVIKR